MLYGRRDDVIALLLRGICHAFERKVIALGTAAGKGDLGGTAVKNLSHLFTRTIYGLHGMSSQQVNTTGITIFSRKVGQHDFQHSRIEWSCSCMIEIDSALWHHKFLFLESIPIVGRVNFGIGGVI